VLFGLREVDDIDLVAVRLEADENFAVDALLGCELSADLSIKSCGAEEAGG
jgi:hypothetical protein